MCNVELIKQLAYTKGMTLSSLEQAVGLGNGTIGKWKKQSPSCDKLKLVADYLSVTLDYLITGKEYPQHAENLPADQQELLDKYKQLSEREQGRILGRMEEMLAKRSDELPHSSNNNATPTAVLDEKKNPA